VLNLTLYDISFLRGCRIQIDSDQYELDERDCIQSEGSLDERSKKIVQEALSRFLSNENDPEAAA